MQRHYVFIKKYIKAKLVGNAHMIGTELMIAMICIWLGSQTQASSKPLITTHNLNDNPVNLRVINGAAASFH